jgi:N(2),N(2)-dimethylguanosine tRNA methyltransferase (EC 2.1.1.32)
LEIPNESLQEIFEGKTKILVPKKSMTDKVPPKEPAFFNPRARVSRDFSIIAYAAFLKKIQRPKNFLRRVVRNWCKRIKSFK